MPQQYGAFENSNAVYIYNPNQTQGMMVFNSFSPDAVYIYNPNPTQAMTVFKSSLVAMLTRLFNPIQFYDLGFDGTVDQVPTLVLCHNYSRIGTDIEDAVSGLTDVINRQHVAVVVIHMKAPHALPLTMPTDTLVDPKYGQYGLLVDFAFQPDAKLYSCNMNDVGKRKLSGFLERYMDRSAVRGSPIGVQSFKDLIKPPWTFGKILFWAIIAAVVVVCFIAIIVYASTTNDTPAPVPSPTNITTPKP